MPNQLYASVTTTSGTTTYTPNTVATNTVWYTGSSTDIYQWMTEAPLVFRTLSPDDWVPKVPKGAFKYNGAIFLLDPATNHDFLPYKLEKVPYPWTKEFKKWYVERQGEIEEGK